MPTSTDDLKKGLSGINLWFLPSQDCPFHRGIETLIPRDSYPNQQIQFF